MNNKSLVFLLGMGVSSMALSEDGEQKETNVNYDVPQKIELNFEGRYDVNKIEEFITALREEGFNIRFFNQNESELYGVNKFQVGENTVIRGFDIRIPLNFSKERKGYRFKF